MSTSARILYGLALLLIGTPAPGQAQDQTVFSFSDGEHNYSVRLKIMKPSKGVHFVGNTLQITSEVPQNIIALSLILDDSENPGAEFSPNIITANDLASIERSCPSLRNASCSVTIKLTHGASGLNTSMQLKISGSQGQVKDLTINIKGPQEAPPTPSSSLSDCAQVIPEQKLACLERKSPKTQEVERAIQALRQEREQARRQLSSISAQRSGNNAYKITCRNGGTTRLFKLDAGPHNRAIENYDHWVIRNIPRTLTVNVASRDWPNLPQKYLTLSPQQSTESPQEESQDTTPTFTDEEDTDVDTLNDRFDRESPDTTASDTLEAMAADTFWRDSIVPQLSLPNVLQRQEALMAPLRTYLDQANLSPTRKVAAFCLYYFWVLTAALIALLGLTVIGLRNRTSQTTAPPPPADEPQTPASKTPKTATATAKIPGSEDEALFDFVEKPHPVPIDKPALSFVSSHPDFLHIDLLSCWADTLLEHLYLSKGFVRDLGIKLQTENAFDSAEDSAEDLSEVGGFLLGHVYPQKNGRYQLVATVFVSITPEFNNRWTVKFGDQAWSQLDDAYKLHPGLNLIGWFHTHPGHGLFLSDADIKVHNDSFERPYQFALEVDPVTPKCDIAFFTRQSSGGLNNREDRKLPHWWSFRALENQAKTL